MKNTHNPFAAEVLTLATCWLITLRDGSKLGFTDSDLDLNIDGVKYIAQTGFNRSAVDSAEGLGIDNLEVEAIIDSNVIDSQDILSGKYDFAEISIFVVDYLEPSSEKLQLRTGWIGEVSVSSGKFVAEIRGLMQAFNTTLGDLYSPSCRAVLGDGKCKVDLKKYEYVGSVSAVLGEDLFIDSKLEKPDGYYNGGTMRFTSGKNKGKSFEIASHFHNTLKLMTTPHFEISPSDEFVLYIGCNKSFDTCVAQFNNAINFRGEPHIPSASTGASGY